MDKLVCIKCGAAATELSDISRSGTPGVGTDHIVLGCTKCGQRIELFGEAAAQADKLFAEATNK